MAVEQIANVTNDVTFEVKAVATDGKVLTDWAAAGFNHYLFWSATIFPMERHCVPAMLTFP